MQQKQQQQEQQQAPQEPESQAQEQAPQGQEPEPKAQEQAQQQQAVKLQPQEVEALRKALQLLQDLLHVNATKAEVKQAEELIDFVIPDDAPKYAKKTLPLILNGTPGIDRARVWEVFGWCCGLDNLAFVKHVQKLGCITVEESQGKFIGDFHRAVHIAAQNGQLEVLKHLHACFKIIPADIWKENYLALAANKGHLHVVQYFCESFPCLPQLAEEFGTLREINDFETFKYLHKYFLDTCKIQKYQADNNDFWSEFLVDSIRNWSRAGALELIQYFFDVLFKDQQCKYKNYDPYKFCAGDAASHGHLELVKHFCTDPRYGLNTQEKATYALHVALDNNLEVTKFLQQHYAFTPKQIRKIALKKDFGGCSRLSEWVQGCRVEHLNYLLELGAINGQDLLDARHPNYAKMNEMLSNIEPWALPK